MQKLSLLLLLTCLTAGLLTSCSEDPGDQVSFTATTAPQELERDPIAKSDGNIQYARTPAIGGTSHIGIILAEFDNTASTYPTKSFQLHPGYAQLVMDAVIDSDSSMARLYEEMTGHLADPVRFTGAIVDAVVIAGTLNSPCSSSSRYDWLVAARDAAVENGANLGDYDIVMVVMSTDNTCAADNFRTSEAYLWANPPAVIINTWDLSQDYFSNDYSHEIGHLLGFGHSNNPQFAYWDYSCLMGENTEYDEVGNPIAWVPNRYLNAIWMIAAGYIDPATEMDTIAGGGRYNGYLAPVEYSPDEVVDPPFGQAYRAIRVNTANEIYYLSYRQPRPPFDINPHGTHAWERIMNRVHVHRFIPDYPAAAELVAVLEAEPGLDTFEGDDFRFTVTTDGLDDDVDYVHVDIELDNCGAGFDAVIDEPTVYRNTTPRWPFRADFLLQVTNLSDPTCGLELFSYQMEVVTGSWQPQPADFLQVELDSGATTTVAPAMVFFQEPGDGTYEGDVRWGPPGDETNTSQATFVLDRAAPTVPGNPTATLNDCTVSLAWTGSSDAVSGLSHYEVFKNGGYLGQTANTWLDDDLVDPAGGATLSYQVRAVDLAGNTSSLSAAASVDLPEVVINNVYVARTNGVDCTITVTWDTNIPSSSVVMYGSTCGVGYIAYGANNTTSHSVVCDVSDLSAFAYIIRSSDGCVTAETACQQRSRGKCITVQ